MMRSIFGVRRPCAALDYALNRGKNSVLVAGKFTCDGLVVLSYLNEVYGKMFMQDWPHSPPHRTVKPGTYMVTAGTYGKIRYFSDPARLNVLTSRLMEYAKRYNWNLQAWAALSNHYHFIGFASAPANLKEFICALHTETARYVNELDKTTNRRVWFQYWDSRISYQKSYYARLKYVHNNPVHHRLVPVAENYPWCSAGWFNVHAEPAFKKTVDSFKTDTLNVFDDF